MNKRYLIIFALLLPLLVFLGMCIINLANIHGGDSWQISIRGYDPRHPLRGHYLTYAYNWNGAAEAASVEEGENGDDALTTRQNLIKNCETYGMECCACFNDVSGDRVDPKVDFYTCAAPELKSCDAFLKGHIYGSDFKFNDQKYYISEKYAPRLEKMLIDSDHDFRIELVITKTGGHTIKGLTIDGVPWKEFIRQGDTE